MTEQPPRDRPSPLAQSRALAGASGRRAAAYGRSISGAERSERGNRHLAYVMAFVAGAVNSVGFVAVAFYTSHMTGLVASFSDELALGRLRLLTAPAVAIASFVTGAAVTAVLFNWMRRRDAAGRYAVVIVLEALLILVFGLLADLIGSTVGELLVIAVLCFVMGLQNALITKLSGARIRTTHVTGMVTDIGIELGKAAYRNRRAGLDPVRHDPAKLRLLLTMVTLFAGGGVLGALGYVALGYQTVIPFAVLLLVAGLLPVLDDVRTVGRRRYPGRRDGHR